MVRLKPTTNALGDIDASVGLKVTSKVLVKTHHDALITGNMVQRISEDTMTL